MGVCLSEPIEESVVFYNIGKRQEGKGGEGRERKRREEKVLLGMGSSRFQLIQKPGDKVDPGTLNPKSLGT